MTPCETPVTFRADVRYPPPLLAATISSITPQDGLGYLFQYALPHVTTQVDKRSSSAFTVPNKTTVTPH